MEERDIQSSLQPPITLVASSAGAPFEALIAVAVVTWVVFAVWMGVLWPDLNLGGRIGLAVMILFGGLSFYMISAMMLAVVLGLFQDLLGDEGWLESVSRAGLIMVILMPYYFTWRYWRRERIDAAGRH